MTENKEERNCRDCVNSVILDSTIKRTCRGCKIYKEYAFFDYWRKTKAPDCKHYSETEIKEHINFLDI